MPPAAWRPWVFPDDEGPVGIIEARIPGHGETDLGSSSLGKPLRMTVIDERGDPVANIKMPIADAIHAFPNAGIHTERRTARAC